jgi:hypothetical protein
MKIAVGIITIAVIVVWFNHIIVSIIGLISIVIILSHHGQPDFEEE